MGKITKNDPALERRSTPSRTATATEIDVLGNQVKSRKCLMCARVFTSEGAHNRICRRCKASQTYRSG